MIGLFHTQSATRPPAALASSPSKPIKIGRKLKPTWYKSRMLPHSPRSARRVLLFVVLFSAALCAQPPDIPTQATVGVPFTFDFGQGFRDIPIPTDIPGFSFTYSFAVAGGSLPPGLSLKRDGLLSGTPTTPGQYSFTVNLVYAVSVPGFSISNTVPIPFGLTVVGGTGPQVSVEPRGLSFPAVVGAAASSQ